MQPVHLLIGLLSNLFTLALLGADIYLVHEWYRLNDSPYDYVRDNAQRYLFWAIGLLIIALLGSPGTTTTRPTSSPFQAY